MSRTTLAALIAMVSVTAMAPSASAVPGDPIIPPTPSCLITLVSGDVATAPPAPTCYDPSGADLDELLVPHVFDSNGNVVSYRNPESNSPYKWDGPNSTNGASQVIVQSSRYDSVVGAYTDVAAWTLTYDTSITAMPTPNTYWVTVGDCVPDSYDLRTVTAFVRNEAGVDARYIGSVYPAAAAKGVIVGDTVPASRVFDGATVGIPLDVDRDTPGLLTGYTYTVIFYLADKGVAWDDQSDRVIGATKSFKVPACGTTAEPPGTSVKPTAKIVVLKRGPLSSKVKVVLGSRQATKASTYRVVINPKVGPTRRMSYVTARRVLKYAKMRRGTLVKIRFGSDVVRKRI